MSESANGWVTKPIAGTSHPLSCKRILPSPWNLCDYTRAQKSCPAPPLSGQIFLQYQRVDAIGIVARDSLHHAIAVALVKRQRRDIIYGGFHFSAPASS